MEYSVSVVIPCYNAEECIQRGLNSVLAQGNAVREIIVVDDGSSDDSVSVVRGWENLTRHPVHVVEYSNQGAGAARNVGLSMATGAYVQFLDADDELLPGKIGSQLERAEEAGNADLVIGAGRMVDHEGRSGDPFGVSPRERDPWLDLMTRGLGITSSNLWKRSSVILAGGWDEALRSSQEYDLMFRMMQQGAIIGYDTQPLTVIHERPGVSISRTNIAANQRQFVELRGRMLRHIETLQGIRDKQPYVQAMYDSLRVLYAQDPDAAVGLFTEHIPTGFKPERSPTTGVTSWMLHRLLGFRRAEALRTTLLGISRLRL